MAGVGSGKEPTHQYRDPREVGSIPGWGRAPGIETSNPFQCSCLENLMDRGAWHATVHRVAKSQTQLRNQTQHNEILGKEIKF